MPRQLLQVKVHARPVAIWVVNGTLHHMQNLACDVLNGVHFGLAIHTCSAVDERGYRLRILISMFYGLLQGPSPLLIGLVLALVATWQLQHMSLLGQNTNFLDR